MDIVIFPQEELLVVLRALRAVASAGGAFTLAESQFISAVARLHGTAVDADTLAPIDPNDVAATVTDPHRRKRAVQLAIVTAFIEGRPGPETEQAVRDLARALDVPEEGVRVLHDVVAGHAMRVRFDVIRRMRSFVTRDEGLPGIMKLALPLLGFGENAETAARYRSLVKCAQGTLGRALFDHYETNGFHFPGEPDGVPERMVFHDIGHVVSGYGVDPQGEIQQAAFQAGFVRTDGFLFLLFGVLQFHIGIRLTPVAKAQQGLFDVERVLRAVARGAACSIDLSDRFDLFRHADESLEALRQRWGVPPA
jgi:hypothetical protein